MVHESDALRSPGQARNPDARTLGFAVVDNQSGLMRQRTLDDQHDAVAAFVLNSSVPDEIATHFETAKNLYLYAWFVFRFYPAAEQHAFASLEFALRERQSDFVANYKRKHQPEREPGLGALLRNAIQAGLVKNEAFRAKERWALERARARFGFEISRKMAEEGLTSMVVDYSQVQVTEEDLSHDWLKDFLDAIPYIRNIHAHGSGMLYHTVLHTFEVVTELINQLYPTEDG